MDNVAQTPAVPRKPIPAKMWASIRTIEEVRASYDGALKGSLREQLINLGAIHGFSETELIQHGIITPRANPNHEGGR